MASITAVGPDTWRVRVYQGRGPDGKERSSSHTIRGTRKDARALALRLEADRIPDNLDGWTATIADLDRQWWPIHTRNLSPSTRVEYRSAIKRHVLPHLGDTTVRTLRPVDLDRLYLKLEAGGLGAARIRRVHNIVSQMMKQAQRWGWIAANPTDAASPPKVTKGHAQAVELADLKALFDAAEKVSPLLVTFLRLNAATGMRRGELVALKWANIDLDAGVVVVAGARVDGGKGVGIIDKDTKTGRVRKFSVAGETIELLRGHRRYLAERYLSAGVPMSPWVFTDDPEGVVPWRPDRATHLFTRARALAGLDIGDGQVKLKDLRHTTATLLIASGVDLRTVANRLGHARTSTTADIYTHPVLEADRAAADLLSGILERLG